MKHDRTYRQGMREKKIITIADVHEAEVTAERSYTEQDR